MLYYADGADVTAYTLDQIKRMYSGLSQTACCFLAELEGQPIAEAWLQTMNLLRIIEAHPGSDCRRIDLSIGEKQHWNKGLGTEIIRALVDFGFAVMLISGAVTWTAWLCGCQGGPSVEDFSRGAAKDSYRL